MVWTVVVPVPRRYGSRLLLNIFLPWLMILPMNGYIPQEKAIQLSCITKENIKSVGTFLFDSTLKKDLPPASLTLLLPSFLREQEGIASSTKVFSEKVEAAEAGGAGEERFSFPREETSSVEPTETVRRRIKLEEKGRLPNLREAFDAYVKAKTLTWSAASAKDIPP